MSAETRVEVAAGQFFVEEFGPGELLITSRPVTFTSDGCGYVVSVPYYLRSEDAGLMEIEMVGPVAGRNFSILEIERQAKALIQVQAFYDALSNQFPFMVEEYWNKLD
ncbi:MULTISPECIES: hypothetical protein [Rhodococcus]|jgi:hypothetical protein|uniref:hypothetical protein n=1 Tax=Rhodococcus TaxID=1827 RepID=UPI00193B98C0|nr:MULTISPECIES: hypothetical protein [Rhodococcus]QRI76267.1 hypothetical protein JQ505_00080 [Rhodococcus aetherivorans]QSE59678.1 hypothetical protein JYA75_01195 [Rhodococcus sp. PSBB066]